MCGKSRGCLQLFPVASNKLSGLKQPTFILLNCQRLEAQNEFCVVKTRASEGLVPSGGSREGIPGLAQLLVAASVPGFAATSLWSLLHGHMAFSSPSAFLLQGCLWSPLVPTWVIQIIFHLKNINLITPTMSNRVPFATLGNTATFWALGQGDLWGLLFNCIFF